MAALFISLKSGTAVTSILDVNLEMEKAGSSKLLPTM
jgi:hypothetical protein